MTVSETLGTPKLDRTRQSAAQVFECLRQAIIGVRLVPGTLLQRTELAGHFHLSQTPIRDALQLLAAEGLVDIFPQHATVVSRIDLSAVQQAQLLRKAVEIELLQQACTLPGPLHTRLMQRLAFHLSAQEAALEQNNLASMAQADQAFHWETYEAAGAQALWDLVRKQSGHAHLPAQGKAQAVIADHRAIYEALGQRSHADAGHALRRHLAGTLSFVDDIKQRYPDWLTGSL
jgi:GntR family transcriptional regulator, rspAB operon transcriptional repressor